METFLTPIGTFCVDDFSMSDARISIVEVEVVEALGPNSVYAWSLDQEEALVEAAKDIGATASLLVPGGFRIVPGEALPKVVEALKARAATMTPTGRTVARS